MHDRGSGLVTGSCRRVGDGSVRNPPACSIARLRPVTGAQGRRLLLGGATRRAGARRAPAVRPRRPRRARRTARHGLPGQAIPADPHGPIGLIRFARSLAWHIAHRPNGLVALAIQYGHMRTALGQWATEGYASRSATASATSSTWRPPVRPPTRSPPLHEDLHNGGGISVPAARRAIRATATAPRFAGAPITQAAATPRRRSQVPRPGRQARPHPHHHCEGRR